MNTRARQKATELRREQQLSYHEIAKRLQVPKSTLSYWLRDLPLSDEKILELRRKGWQKGEVKRERFRNTMRKKLRFFIKWLEIYLDIPKSDVKIQLHLYETMDIETETEFWQNLLGVEMSQFYKTQVRKLREGSFSYKESFRHGTCQVIYYSGDKKARLVAAMKAFVDSFIN